MVIDAKEGKLMQNYSIFIGADKYEGANDEKQKELKRQMCMSLEQSHIKYGLSICITNK